MSVPPSLLRRLLALALTSALLAALACGDVQEEPEDKSANNPNNSSVFNNGADAGMDTSDAAPDAVEDPGAEPDTDAAAEPDVEAGVDADAEPDTASLCDLDGDGAQAPSCGGDDCDEGAASIHPGAEELCDGLDNDCDELPDEDCDCVQGSVRPCGVAVGVCVEGAQTCTAGQWGGCEGAVLPSDEVCNLLDDDCDGQADEDDACDACDPGFIEVCDGLDNNCDGQVDEQCTRHLHRLAAGEKHTCLVQRSGRLVCWGDTVYDETLFSAEERFAAVETGYSSTCAVRPEGTLTCRGGYPEGLWLGVPEVPVSALGFYTTWQPCLVDTEHRSWCWMGEPHMVEGVSDVAVTSNSSEEVCFLIQSTGELACYGSSPPSYTFPHAVPAGPFVEIDGSVSHICGLRVDGSVACTGPDVEGVVAPPVGPFTRVTVGERFACALRPDGTAACWGKDEQGQASPPSTRFVEIDAGGAHACGLRADDGVECWGSDAYGQATPSVASGRYAQVALGEAHTCALTEAGEARCWRGQYPTPRLDLNGTLDDLQISGHQVCFRYGASTNTPRDSCVHYAGAQRGNWRTSSFRSGQRIGYEHSCWPGEPADRFFCIGRSIEGQDAEPALSFTEVDPGGFHTCGVSTSGVTVCWGSDQYGQATPPVGEALTGLALGHHHSCGLRADGEAVCWGRDDAGQASPPASESFTALASGVRHTCGLRADGRAVCWGRSGEGQTTPPAAESFVALRAGFDVSCGLTAAGVLRCWGRQAARVDPGTEERFERFDAAYDLVCAAPVGGLSFQCWDLREASREDDPPGVFTQLSASVDYNCGLRTDGEVSCWGRGFNGELEPPPGPFIQVSAGRFHACALRTDGEVACWGANASGEATPPAGPFVQIEADDAWTCGVRASGEIACWGADLFDRLHPPPGTFSRVAITSLRGAGVREDGVVEWWESGAPTQLYPWDDPVGLQISEGASAALFGDGRIEYRDFEEAALIERVLWREPPPGPFVQMDFRNNATCAIREGGELVCWGAYSFGR